MANISVFVLQSEKKGWPRSRPQRWYWTAANADNHKELGISSEMYTNKQDAIDCATELFGPKATITLYVPESEPQVIRKPLPEPPLLEPDPPAKSTPRHRMPRSKAQNESGQLSE